MTKRQVAVEDLEYGMYVAELDRPWLETDFLFQGFVIRDAEDLRRLRAWCQWVRVDPVKSENVAGVDEGPVRDRPADLRKPSASPAQGTSGSAPKASQSAGGALGPSQSSAPVAPQEPDFARALPDAIPARRQAEQFVHGALQSLAEDRQVALYDARTAVHKLTEAVSLNANAALWLNNLRRENEYVAAHCLNVCVLTLGFAEHLGYAGEELEALGLGALLHDIGFVRIPGEIVAKPGALGEDEWAEIQHHPERGRELAEQIPGLPAIAVNIVRDHHERLSGGGYPRGLQGRDVPREALIVAICDVYDSMTGEQPWSPAMSPHGSLSVLRQISPGEFGTELAREFLSFIGIYPVSTLVELKSGALAMVVSHTPQNRLKPTVMVLRDAGGQDVTERPLVDLSALGEEELERWGILRVLDPAESGVDVSRITAAYLDRLL